MSISGSGGRLRLMDVLARLKKMRYWRAKMLVLVGLLFSATAIPQPERPEAVVRQLYRQIVARKPLGIPSGADKMAIWPLLSKRLVQQLDTAQSCEDDYYRLHTGDDGKPEFGWLELGLFSGGNEEAIPAEVQVERTESQGKGTFQVSVRFTYKESFETYGRPPNPNVVFHWRGAAIVKLEDGRFVVDDVLLFKEGSTKISWRLSSTFQGCDGPRWVGEGEQE